MPTDFKGLVDLIVGLIVAALPVVVGLALAVFFWGLAKFIFHVGEGGKALEDGKKLIIWGLVALFVMTSFMGILYFAYNDFGFIRSFGQPRLPQNN